MKYLFILFILTFKLQASSHLEEETLPLWEYGFGAGYVRYEQYPASNENSHFFLPFPTFQYRGNILRADDREGARAYLIKKENWSIDIGGGALPSVDSSKNKAREGMKDLLWGLQLGPEINYRISPILRWKWGIYSAINTDFRFTKTSGFVSEASLKINLEDFFEHNLLKKTNLKDRVEVALTAKGASQEFLATYFDVSTKDVTAERSFYKSKAGMLEYHISYYHVFNFTNHSLYFGAIGSNYSASANRKSPLHKSDKNVSYVVGVTYKLGESEEKARLN